MIKLIKPSCKILFFTPQPIQFIEYCGRVCYKSEDKITPNSAEKFVQKLIKSGHHSVLEHAVMTVHFVCDRGVSHELVRHRLMSVSQESTRYCNYKDGITFISPDWFDPIDPHDEASAAWYDSIVTAEFNYNLILETISPQQARAALTNSLKTELICTANIREWRHIYSLRSGKAAHPQMRELMELFKQEILREIDLIPLFEDLWEEN